MMKSRGEDRKHKEDFLPGDNVWIEATNIHSNRPMAKLDHKRYGPFKVLKKVGECSYQLKLPETWAIHNVFHTSLLTRHHKLEFDSQRKPLPPPPDIINNKEEYEVEEIRGHRKRGQGVQFLFHWKGYDDVEDSWLPKSALENSEELVNEYINKNKLPFL